MKPLLAIFAHPDDEAFYAGGTLAIESKKRETYLLCVTNGAAGKNSTASQKDLSDIRRLELKHSAKHLGINKVFFLEYEDGSLCNAIYHEVAEKIHEVIDEVRPDTIMTFEPRGITGHLDHVAVSMISTFTFEKNDEIKTILYNCINTTEQKLNPDDYFIYFPPGYRKNQIQKTVNISKVWDTKIAALHAHKSQKHDVDYLINILTKLPKEEYFLVKNK